MSGSAVFLKCFLLRVGLAVLFSWYGYLGFGGDPDAYHVLGRYLREVLADPAHASFERVLQAQGIAELEKSYEMHIVNVRDFWSGRDLSQYLNTVTPIVFLHATSYLVWDNPFSFVLLTSLLSSLAVARLVTAFKLTGEQAGWLIFNPVSIFFAATHFKEGVSEVLVLCFVAALYGEHRPVRGLLWVGLMLLFRTSFAAILASFYLFKYTPAGRLRPLLFFVVTLALLPLVPREFGVGESEVRGAGPIYSLIYYNRWTMQLLGPLLGLLLPMPLQILLSRGALDSGLIFTAVYGFYYYAVGGCLLLHLRYARYSDEALRLLNTVIFVSLLIGYLFLGGSGVKDRYFAPFFPVMILAVIFLSAVRERVGAGQDGRLVSAC